VEAIAQTTGAIEGEAITFELEQVNKGKFFTMYITKAKTRLL